MGVHKRLPVPERNFFVKKGFMLAYSWDLHSSISGDLSSLVSGVGWQWSVQMHSHMGSCVPWKKSVVRIAFGLQRELVTVQMSLFGTCVA